MLKIEEVKITGIWNKFEINWKLDSSVNVLSGINGVGKTTVLDIIASLCYTGSFPKEISKHFSSVRIRFNNGYELVYIRIRESISKLSQIAKKEIEFKEILDNVKKDFGDNLSKINQISIEAGITKATKNGIKCSVEEVLELLKISIVSTFDKPLKKDADALKVSELKNINVKTELDWEIYRLQEEYLNYQVNISKIIESEFGKKDVDIDNVIRNIYTKKNTFKYLINQLFSDTNKKIDEDQNRISFVCADNSKLTPYQLSSGEKQLLIIILKALLQNEGDCIFFMDEPEISLHIDWQKTLLKNIKILNPNAQIIIASHSPAMIMDGWLDKVTNLQDIIKSHNK